MPFTIVSSKKRGGLVGVRDPGLLQSIAHRPQTAFGGVEQFPDVFTKAAVYLESVATYHVFLDANKRTALSTAAVFLHLNGFELSVPIAETERFIVAAAQRHHSLVEIAAWLKKRSKKRR